jgi:PAS domain S-box-containing protein
MYSPVYRAGARPPSLASRRDAFLGWVYVPFRVHQFVDAALGSYRPEGGFDIHDVTGGSAQLLYRTDRPSGAAGQPAFANSLWLEAYGRRWRIDFHPAPDISTRGDMPALRNTLWAGLAMSFLLFGITLSLVRTQARAQRLASRMSESYRRSEMRFRSALQYSAIGKALLDQEGRIVEANPALARILGRSPEALAGTRFASYLEGAESDARQSGSIDVMEEGVHRTTRRLRRGDGDLRQLQLTFASVPGDIDQDIARLVQVDDVTERMRAEARIHALNRTLEARVAMRTRELTQANQELESFAYSVSHDLRAPLRSIDGFSRLLTERYADRIDDSGKDYLARIRNAAGRMGELIDALLKMSRLTRSELKMTALDLSRMAGEIASELRAADPRRTATIDIAPGLRAYGDQALVRNLLQNLIGNAWKFTAGKPNARITVGRNEQQEYFVRDNGAGFAQEYIDKLFRPFQRLHSQEEFAGHGIGLASVKRIVERHGGGIRAEGKPGEGAAFYFTLAPEPVED